MPSAADWLDRAVLAGQAPRRGDSEVIAPGYRRDDFLTGPAVRGEIPLGTPRPIDAAGTYQLVVAGGGIAENS